LTRLDAIVQATRDEVERRKRERPLADLEREADRRPEGRPFHEALARPGTSLIAEHKRRSPSAGEIREGASVTEIVRAYERGGAAALSILTEERHFGGSLADLTEARAASELPILRKDFTIDRYQLYEAKAAGRRTYLRYTDSMDVTIRRRATLSGALRKVLDRGELRLVGERRFTLHGRKANLVKIAGKRTSIEALNAALLRVEGVRDGVFYLRDGAERVGALVVAPGVSPRALRAALRRHIDPAFLPRPLHFVAALPRSENGKLTRDALLEMVDSLESVSS